MIEKTFEHGGFVGAGSQWHPKTENRLDSLVKVEFKVEDTPGTITDSGSPEMYDAIMKLLETFQAYDIKFDSEPIREGGSNVPTNDDN